MRLELNLPALERLLGGDTEVELHLRQQIVDEFAKKHLKAILNDETWKRASKQWTADLDAAVTTALAGFAARREDNAKVDQTVRWRLDDTVKKAAQAAVDEAVKNVIERQKHIFAPWIDRAVREAMDCDIKKRVEAEIQRRLKAAQDAG